MFTYIKTNILYFSVKFGFKISSREVFRIIGRMIFEHKKNIIMLGKSEEGDVLAYAVARELPKKYRFPVQNAYIVGPVYVLPEARGKGIGIGLLQSILEDIGEKSTFYAYILIQNERSIHVFEKVGFKKIGYMEKKNKEFYLVKQETAFVLMEKRDDNNQEG